jgi:hypothetical protein
LARSAASNIEVSEVQRNDGVVGGSIVRREHPVERPKLRRFADHLPFHAVAVGVVAMFLRHDHEGLAALGVVFVSALVLSRVLRKVSGLTWREALWPRREPPWWAQLSPSMASVRELARAGLRIQAVKMYRELTGADLVAGVNAVDAMVAHPTSDNDEGEVPVTP